MSTAADGGMMGAPAGRPAGSETPKETTMNGITKTAGRLAAVGAVALLLAGASAAPAEARTRSQAVRKAGILAPNCTTLGGTPYAFDTGEDIVFGCAYAADDVETWYIDVNEDE